MASEDSGVYGEAADYLELMSFGFEDVDTGALQTAPERAGKSGSGIITPTDGALMQKARRLSWKICGHMDEDAYLRNYQIMENVGRIAKGVDVGRLLSECSVGKSVPDSRAYKYSLLSIVLEGDGLNGHVMTQIHKNAHYSVGLDQPVGICLVYEDVPSAVVGFLATDYETLMINQMQGVIGKEVDEASRETGKIRGSRGIDSSLDYRKLLVKVGALVGDGVEMPATGIRSGRNNIWTGISYDDGRPHMSGQAAIERYDKVAERLGFCQKADGNWYRPSAEILTL